MRVVGPWIADITSASPPISRCLAANVGELPSGIVVGRRERKPNSSGPVGWTEHHLSALERHSGVLTVASARIGGQVVLGGGYLPGQENSRARLIEVIRQTSVISLCPASRVGGSRVPCDEHRLVVHGPNRSGIDARDRSNDQLIPVRLGLRTPKSICTAWRFHRVAASYGNRLVEQSPLPFGRPLGAG